MVICDVATDEIYSHIDSLMIARFLGKLSHGILGNTGSRSLRRRKS